jgi:hypothetical protein
MLIHRSLLALLIALLALTGTAGSPAHAQAAPAAPGTPALPSSCGQVCALADGSLADDSGRWTMRGVQFFLPQYGINGKTLRDDNYAAARDDGSLAFWLGRAQDYLRANMLCVFVDLPDNVGGSTTVTTSTSYSTLHDFAPQANTRGMRLGLVLHNSADWSMAEPRASWIAGLLDYFDARGNLPMLADMREKDTATACGDPNKSFALWTGLFAIGGTYCAGGTANRNADQPQATALRVCIAYTGHFSACTAGTPFAVRGYLPVIAR